MSQVGRAETYDFSFFVADDDAGDDFAQANRLLAGRCDNGQNFCAGEKVLNEGDLDFHTVFAVVCVAVANGGFAFEDSIGKLFVNGDFAQRREPGALVVNGRGLADIAVSRAENDEGVDFRVLLSDGGKDIRGGSAAESPAGVRNDAGDYRFGKGHIQGRLIEAFVYLVNALVVLAGVELACHNWFSLLHTAYLSVAFATPSRYDYTIIPNGNIL